MSEAYMVAVDKDEPLIADIGLLGQILGETVREQEGDAVFELIETIRLLSIAITREESRDDGCVKVGWRVWMGCGW